MEHCRLIMPLVVLPAICAEYPQSRETYRASGLDGRCRLPTHTPAYGYHAIG
eukprot:SAG11_NODE_18967_length_477_cov_0.550265_1_plen_51_part_10